jgi:trehalose 6-phosphate synthase/phosphatase
VRPVILDQQGGVQYKYAIFSQADDKFVRWEAIEGDRTLSLERAFALPCQLPHVHRCSFACAADPSVEISRLLPSDFPSPHPRKTWRLRAASHIHLQTNDALDTLEGGPGLTAGHAPSHATPVRGLSLRATQLMSSAATESPTSAGQDVQLAHTDGVIIVSNLLPVNIRKIVVDGRIDFEVSWNHDHLLSMKTKQMEGLRVLWVGGVHVTMDSVGGGGLFDGAGDFAEVDEMDELLLEQRLLEFNCVPVLISHDVLNCHHDFCRTSLFPVFNSVVDVYGPLATENVSSTAHKKNWECYVRTNRKFAEKAMEQYQSGDLIWVHNYQLMLMPSYLLQKIPDATICYYMHQPWPSSELFRTLSVREEILLGMLNSDIIGFQSFDFARNFLTACSRLLGLSYSVKKGGNLTIDYNGRHIEIYIEHVAVEPDMLSAQLHDPCVKAAIDAYTEQFRGKRLILAIDDLYRLSGIAFTLLAYEQLLDESPHLAKNTVLMQLGVENFYERSSDFELVCRECSEICDRISSRHGNAVVYKRVSTLPSVDRLALMSIADVYMNSAIRSGLNLRPFEYVYVNQKKGVVLMSEYNCAVRALSGCVCTNPFNVNDTRAAIDSALMMGEAERSERHERDLLYVTNHATSQWAQNILVEMKRVSRADEGSNYSYVGYGLGLRFRVLRVRADFQKLSIQKVQQAYKLCNRRLFLLDFGGTLVGDGTERTASSNFWAGGKKGAGLSDTQIEIMKSLASDKRNTVFIVSGRGREDLEVKLSGIHPELGLAAELGYFLKLPRSMAPLQKIDSAGEIDEPTTPKSDASSGYADTWSQRGWQVDAEDKVRNVDDSWREVTVAIMAQYQKRTQGSRVEPKQTSVTFSFRDSDPDYGKMQAAELKSHLEGVLIRHAGFPVVTVSGNRYLEVRLKGVNKGECLLSLMKRMAAQPGAAPAGGPPDFCMCIGNDDHDEFMYAALHACDGTSKPEDTDGWFNCLNEPGKQLPQVRQDFVGFSAIVGRKASTARYYLEDVDESWELLSILNQAAQRAQQNQSMVDLRSLDRMSGGSDGSPRSSDTDSAGAGLASFGRIRRTERRAGGEGGLASGGAARLGGMRRAGGMGGYRTSVGDLASLAEGS